ncbi:MAG: Asp23/Gls24 family envelope stress response protein [Eubacterium sp.]|nr:Asp23/Gls24 family envelope stress response protein [Eubacterium sp.]
MDNSKDNTFTIGEESAGIIQVADDVVSSIAALAVLEVDGVSRLTGNISNDLVAKLGKRNLSKALRVIFEEDKVRVDVTIEAKFGYNLIKISNEVQEKVKSSLMTMTGLECTSVNVKISGIDMDGENV